MLDRYEQLRRDNKDWRDACDLGYLVTTVTDFYATQSQERHDWSLRNHRIYVRQMSTMATLEKIAWLTA